jgi:hypothetical protein
LWRKNIQRTVVINKDEFASGKFSKERVSILFCVSLAGDKLPLLIIGKPKNPRCFKINL